MEIQRLSIGALENLKLLYSKSVSFFRFAQMEPMCADQDKSDEMRTPKYLKASTCSSGVSRTMEAD